MIVRKFLISETSVRLLIREVTAIKRTAVSTPDTEASFKVAMGILKGLVGEVP